MPARSSKRPRERDQGAGSTAGKVAKAAPDVEPAPPHGALFNPVQPAPGLLDDPLNPVGLGAGSMSGAQGSAPAAAGKAPPEKRQPRKAAPGRGRKRP